MRLVIELQGDMKMENPFWICQFNHFSSNLDASVKNFKKQKRT